MALGQSIDADALIALGITPVGMSTAFQQESGFHPWTAAALGSRHVELLRVTTAAAYPSSRWLRSSLATTYNTTNNDYDTDRPRLEQIAKVIGPTSIAQRGTWQQSTIRVGEAVGLGNEARRLVEDTEAKLAAFRKDHPEWKGKTFTVGPVLPDGQVYTTQSTQDISAVLLQQLVQRRSRNGSSTGVPGRVRLGNRSR